MAHNPELDHEYREDKFDEKPKPIIFRDHDGINEPYEMMTINQAGGLKTNGWKQKLIMAVVVIAAFALGAFLMYGVGPWLASLLNPNAPPPALRW